MRVIANQLGDADARMTEQHYVHLSPSYVAETNRASFTDLGIVQRTRCDGIVTLIAVLRPF